MWFHNVKITANSCYVCQGTKSKVELASGRIRRLLELISSYSFNLYYIKGKDRILSNFPSRQKHDNSNPHDIIPISFNMHNILHEKILQLRTVGQISSANSITDKIKQDNTTWQVHSIKKILDTNSIPEKLKTNPQAKKGSEIKPRIGQW